MFSTLVQQPSNSNSSSEATTPRQAPAWLKAVKSAVRDVATVAAHHGGNKSSASSGGKLSARLFPDGAALSTSFTAPQHHQQQPEPHRRTSSNVSLG